MSQPKQIDQIQVVHRRKIGDKLWLIAEWVPTGPISGDELRLPSEFDGFGAVEKTLTDGTKSKESIQFPINNVKTLDEAFTAYNAAYDIAVKVMNAQEEQKAIAKHQQQMRSERNNNLNKALGGIPLGA